MGMGNVAFGGYVTCVDFNRERRVSSVHEVKHYVSSDRIQVQDWLFVYKLIEGQRKAVIEGRSG